MQRRNTHLLRSTTTRPGQLQLLKNLNNSCRENFDENNMDWIPNLATRICILFHLQQSIIDSLLICLSDRRLPPLPLNLNVASMRNAAAVTGHVNIEIWEERGSGKVSMCGTGTKKREHEKYCRRTWRRDS